MHAFQREKAIEEILQRRDFIAVRDLHPLIEGSPSTIRRDLGRMAAAGRIERLRGGVRRCERLNPNTPLGLAGTPFRDKMGRNSSQKEAIGRAAAKLCEPGEGVMIDGGASTLQMCDWLEGLGLSVLTNSLHIVNALARQAGTRILMPGGALFREQNIILSPLGEDHMPRFFAPKLFMGAAAVGSGGVVQPDPVLVASGRCFIERAQQVILLVDSSKFGSSSGQVVCDLQEIDTVITDDGINDQAAEALEAAQVRLIIA